MVADGDSNLPLPGFVVASDSHRNLSAAHQRVLVCGVFCGTVGMASVSLGRFIESYVCLLLGARYVAWRAIPSDLYRSDADIVAMGALGGGSPF